MAKRKSPTNRKGQRRTNRKNDNWVQRITRGLDDNAQLVRRAAVLMIMVLVMNPLLLITIRSLIVPKMPNSFCDEFVLDIDGGEQCTADRLNTQVFMQELRISGRKCTGELNRNFYSAPLISVWASNTYDLR